MDTTSLGSGPGAPLAATSTVVGESQREVASPEGSRRPSKGHLPPGNWGIPGLRFLNLVTQTGPLLLFTLPYIRWCQWRYKTDIWRVVFLGGQRAVVVLGAEAQQEILAAQNADLFLAAPGYAFLARFLGNSLFTSDGAVHDQHKRLMAPAFHSRYYSDFVEQMSAEAAQVLSLWGEQGTCNFHSQAQRTIGAMSFKLTASVDVEDEADLNHSLPDAFSQMQVGINMLWHHGRTWSAAVHARNVVIPHQLRRLLDERRAALAREESPHDVLGLLLEARIQDDQGVHQLTDDEIINEVVLSLFAGRDTSTSASTWMMVEMLRNPAILARVRKELGASQPSRAPAAVTLADVQHTPYTDAVLEETLRLHPSAHLFVRGLSREWKWHGFVVPAGTSVIAAPLHTSRKPEYWTEPLQFDPDRFLPPREEQNTTKFAYVPFGGGAHACLGTGLAPIMVKVLIASVLRRFDLTLLPRQNLNELFVPTPRPRSGGLMSYRV